MWKKSADRVIYGSKSGLEYIFGGLKYSYFVTFSQKETTHTIFKGPNPCQLICENFQLSTHAYTCYFLA